MAGFDHCAPRMHHEDSDHELFVTAPHGSYIGAFDGVFKLWPALSVCKFKRLGQQFAWGRDLERATCHSSRLSVTVPFKAPVVWRFLFAHRGERALHNQCYMLIWSLSRTRSIWLFEERHRSRCFFLCEQMYYKLKRATCHVSRAPLSAPPLRPVLRLARQCLMDLW